MAVADPEGIRASETALRAAIALYGQFWSGWSGPVAPIPTLEGTVSPARI